MGHNLREFGACPVRRIIENTQAVYDHLLEILVEVVVKNTIILTRMREWCAMSLELPPLVRSGIFCFFTSLVLLWFPPLSQVREFLTT